MDVLPTTAAYAPPSAGTTDAATATPGTAALSSDFDTFLKMLTAQARYQDPLEPIDSSEYAAQLAQFSMVEQQVLTNDSLAALTSQIGTQNIASLAGLVGMEARSSAPVHFDGAPVTIYPTPAAVADAANLVVRSVDGLVLDRRPIAVSDAPIQWDGTGAQGLPLDHGHYALSVESLAGDSVLTETPIESYAAVTEAQNRGGQTVVLLAGGQAVETGAIAALRAP